jgi:outer membrane receptor for ferrienterochelin and colicins
MVLVRFTCLSLLGLPVLAQQPADTLRRQKLGEVVVTATRTERSSAEVPMPVTVIGAKQINAMGSVRLNDVLGEQTGLSIVADHGRGVQMQGLNPEYTLILVDGEPLIGRTAGTLELSRVAVGNIQRVEVVKGPASALWGSEALAGVVNIITQKPQAGTSGTLRLRYGSNRTADVSASFNQQGERLGITAFLNRYSSAGYTLRPESGTATVPPFANYTAQSRLIYQLGERTKLSVSGRYFAESQASTYPVATAAGTREVRYESRQQDYSLNPVLTHGTANGRLFATARFYAAGYRTREDYTYTADGSAYDNTYFNQTFLRPEGQLDWRLGSRHTLTGGAGYIRESVAATRYDATQLMQSYYGFVQDDWTPLPGLNVVAGARYDGHNQYKRQLSPKASARYQVRPWLAVRGSAGRGYRAPDFRQLYLNFSNPAVGYSVFGTQEVGARLTALAQAGQLMRDPATGQPLINTALLDRAGSLRPESSVAYNAGLQLDPTEKLSFTASYFRNSLRDLIETTPVAQKTNGQSVFTYYNVSRAYTQGVEAEAGYQLLSGLRLSGGYQYLVAKDQAVEARLAAGDVYRRDPTTLLTERVKAADYGGLFNRSKHSGNVKLFYDNTAKGLTASLRGIYRGRYGFQDLNGNAILDTDAEYVRGYTLWNVAASKTWQQRYTLQVGVDNALGYTDPAYIGTLPGRLLYATVELRLAKK